MKKTDLIEAITYVRTPGCALVRINSNGTDITSEGAAHCAVILLAAMELLKIMDQDK